MLKIVEIHPSANPQGEYVVLQNQGLGTVNLRGWAICTEDYLEGSLQEAIAGMYVFRENVAVKPYARVVLFTGRGEAGWVPTIDGKQAYCTYWGRTQALWKRSQRVHVLQIAASRKVVPEYGTVGAEAPSLEETASKPMEAVPQYAIAHTR